MNDLAARCVMLQREEMPGGVSDPVDRACVTVGDCLIPSGPECGPRHAEQTSSHAHQHVIAGAQGMFAGVQRNFLLGNDRPAVYPRVDVMDRDALRRAVEPGPEVRVCPSIPWQQRNVNVDEPAGELAQQRFPDDVPVSERNNPICVLISQGLSCGLPRSAAALNRGCKSFWIGR